MKFLLLSFIIFRLSYAYTDLELEDLWSRIPDINHPTLEDYRSVESYLQYGKRPYLIDYYNSSRLWGFSPSAIAPRIDQFRNFKLIGPNEEMPIFEVHAINISEKTKDRCVLIFGSYNGLYPQHARSALEQLRKCNYSGHVIMRIGGFPNASAGGLKFSPFMSVWKTEFIHEALQMGFKKIIHLDSCIQPLCDLNDVFDSMETDGYLLFSSNEGMLRYHPHYSRLDCVRITPEEAWQVPWLPGYIIGFNFDHTKGAKLFNEWERAINSIDQLFFLSWDEATLSIVAWKNHCPPSDTFSKRVYQSSTPPDEQAIADNDWFFFFDTRK